MRIGLLYEKEIKIEFIYSPIFEMLSALHVLVNPSHHLDRLDWADRILTDMDADLLKEIRILGEKTYNWLIVMDIFQTYEECEDLSILSVLDSISIKPLYEINKIFSLYNKSINEKEKADIFKVLNKFYLEYFQQELKYIEPLLVRVLKKDIETAKEDTLKYIGSIHERIEITENEIKFHKNKVYSYSLDSLKIIKIRPSTFMSPHLLIDTGENEVYLTRLIKIGDKKDLAPSDLIYLLKALGDETRLKIVREMKRSPQSTQNLAKTLKLTEACISKHLKILYEAELLYKKRHGNYIYYYLNLDSIDYIPYKIYEYFI